MGDDSSSRHAFAVAQAFVDWIVPELGDSPRSAIVESGADLRTGFSKSATDFDLSAVVVAAVFHSAKSSMRLFRKSQLLYLCLFSLSLVGLSPLQSRLQERHGCCRRRGWRRRRCSRWLLCLGRILCLVRGQHWRREHQRVGLSRRILRGRIRPLVAHLRPLIGRWSCGGIRGELGVVEDSLQLRGRPLWLLRVMPIRCRRHRLQFLHSTTKSVISKSDLLLHMHSRPVRHHLLRSIGDRRWVIWVGILVGVQPVHCRRRCVAVHRRRAGNAWKLDFILGKIEKKTPLLICLESTGASFNGLSMVAGNDVLLWKCCCCPWGRYLCNHSGFRLGVRFNFSFRLGRKMLIIDLLRFHLSIQLVVNLCTCNWFPGFPGRGLEIGLDGLEFGRRIVEFFPLPEFGSIASLPRKRRK